MRDGLRFLHSSHYGDGPEGGRVIRGGGESAGAAVSGVAASQRSIPTSASIFCQRSIAGNASECRTARLSP